MKAGSTHLWIGVFEVLMSGRCELFQVFCFVAFQNSFYVSEDKRDYFCELDESSGFPQN